MASNNKSSKIRTTYTSRDLLLGLIIPAVTFIVAGVGIVLQVASQAASNEQQSVPTSQSIEVR